MEYYKLIQHKDTIDNYRNYYINSGTCIYTSSEPAPAKQINWVNGKTRTEWDLIEIYGDITINQFIYYMMEKYGVLTTTITSDNNLIWCEFIHAHRNKEKPIIDIIKEFLKEKGEFSIIASKRCYVLDISCTSLTTNADENAPLIVLYPYDKSP